MADTLIPSLQSILDSLAPPPFPGEDPTDIDALRKHVRADLGPYDVVEQFWVEDLVQLRLELIRYWKAKRGLLTGRISTRLRKLLGDGPDTIALVVRWQKNEPEAVRQVTDALERAGTTLDALVAEVVVANLPDTERLDRCLADAERRLAATMQAFDSRAAPPVKQKPASPTPQA